MTRARYRSAGGEGHGSRGARLLALILVLVLGSPLLAQGRAFRSTLHGNRERGPARRAEVERGSCVQCHNGHASHDRGSRLAELGLFAANDNELCFSCHTAPSDLAIFPSSGEWMLSSHATSPRAVAPDRPSGDVNKCVNCHDPHGARVDGRVVPSMLADRETELCLSCHDGLQGSDVAGVVLRGVPHGDRALGTHDASEGGDPLRFSAVPAINRHVACSDCHNAHVAAEDRYPAEPPLASRRLAGVSRVQVFNGPAGLPPSYEWLSAVNPQPVQEYEICFKCHSSWTKQPPGQPDLALLTNPANPSFHPIQDVGRNPFIEQAAFVEGMSADTMLTCTSCHSGDDSWVRGPHASSFPYLLGRPSSGKQTRERMSRDDICFACHTWDVYADPSSPQATHAASRFNAPSTSGHAFHVGTQQVTCYACHETHGSPDNASLIATSGRPLGVRSFRPTPTGGECSSTCHGLRTYVVNYPR